MKKTIYYNLKEATYFIKQLAISELSQFESLNPQLIPIDIPERNVNEKLVNTLNKFFRDK